MRVNDFSQKAIFIISFFSLNTSKIGSFICYAILEHSLTQLQLVERNSTALIALLHINVGTVNCVDPSKKLGLYYHFEFNSKLFEKKKQNINWQIDFYQKAFNKQKKRKNSFLHSTLDSSHQ